MPNPGTRNASQTREDIFQGRHMARADTLCIEVGTADKLCTVRGRLCEMVNTACILDVGGLNRPNFKRIRQTNRPRQTLDGPQASSV